MGSYAVIGLGRFGTQLAKQLYKQGCEVLAIDKNQSIIDDIADDVTQAVSADATNQETLMTLGVNECDCAIVSSASDLASSVLITMALKNIGVPKVICKAHDMTHEAILQKLGADLVVIPERAAANKLANTLIMPNVEDSINLGENYSIVESSVPASWVDQKLKDLNVRAKYHITVIAIRDPKGGVIASPGADDVLHADDTMVLVGSLDDLKRLETKAAKA